MRASAVSAEVRAFPVVTVPGPPYLSLWARPQPHDDGLDRVRVTGYDGRNVIFVDAREPNPVWAQNWSLSYEAFAAQYDREAEPPCVEPG